MAAAGASTAGASTAGGGPSRVGVGASEKWKNSKNIKVQFFSIFWNGSLWNKNER